MKKYLTFGLSIFLSLGVQSSALAVTMADPGGVTTKIITKGQEVGLALAAIGFIASWILNAISLGNEKLANQAKAGATTAIVSGIILGGGVTVYKYLVLT